MVSKKQERGIHETPTTGWEVVKGPAESGPFTAIRDLDR